MRIFLSCTPRTGNTYFRAIWTGMWGLANAGVYVPAQVDWNAVPERCLIAIHRHHHRASEGFLRERGFRIATIARHPLDVLMSILHYAQTQSAYSLQWLEGECGNENALIGAGPADAAFARYALSWRAEALFAVSIAWARVADVVLRYEALVTEPVVEVARFAAALGYDAIPDPAPHVAVNAAPAFAAAVPGHVWTGSAGRWRRYLVPELAHAVAQRHQAAFEAFGYTCDPDPELTPAMARANWRSDAGEVPAPARP